MKLHPIFSLVSGFTLTAHAALPFPNHDKADLVLGQPNFTSSLALNPPTASSLNSTASVTVDPVSRKVFVCDRDNLRILRYASATALASGAPAEFALGQASFTTNADAGSNSLKSRGLFIDSLGRLWVADSSNHRVLMFTAASTRNNSSADKVFGQPDAAMILAGTAAEKMNFPTDVCVDSADRLWVADSKNNRVLRFDGISKKPSGAAADGVLGQTNFTINTANSGASGLQSPYGIAVSGGGALYVTCSDTHRVLRFDKAATLSAGAGASAVLGQPDFATTTAGISAVKLEMPTGVAITAQDALWVVDTGNHRLLRFSNASTKLSGAAADGVLGQPDFSSKSFGTSQQGVNFPQGNPFVDPEGRLWVADSGNRRVLRFSPPTSVVVPPVLDKTAPMIAISGRIPKRVTTTRFLLKGTASDASGIKSVQYQIGKSPLKTATGTTNWQISIPLKKGKNYINLIATDTAGNVRMGGSLIITRK